MSEVLDFLHTEIVKAFDPGTCAESDKDLNGSKLEQIGFLSGYKMVERYTSDSSRLKEELDAMKFVCKEFWIAVYGKPVDTLRTNHQGIYVFHDNKFRFLKNISEGVQYLESTSKYLIYTCGLIRGSLANLGYSAVVTAEVPLLPCCKFHVQVQSAL